MTSVHRFRSWAHAIGTLLALVSVSFIAILLWSQRHVLLDFHFGISGVLVLALSSIAYAAAGLLLSAAWRLLLHWSGEHNVHPDESRRIYARTQLAKYVPGNVAHLLGRHVVGRQAGWSHIGLLLSALFELVSLLGVGTAIAILGLAVTGLQVGLLSFPWLLAVLAGLAGFGSVFLRIGPELLVRRWPEIAIRVANCRIHELWPMALFHAGYFLIGGLILLLVSLVVLGPAVDLASWPALLSLFAMAWMAGVITPGAPSGLGVRETVIVLGLASVAPAAQASLVATLLRLVTVGGDLLFFLLAGGQRRG